MEQPRATLTVVVPLRDKLEKLARLNGFRYIATYLEWHATKELKKLDKKD